MTAVAGRFVLRDVLLRAADLHGDEPAVSCGERTLSWRQLVGRTHRVANWLGAHDVGRGDRVLVLSANCLEIAELAYAIAELGAVMVPLSPIAAGAEIRYILEDAEVKVGLAPPSLEHLTERAGGRWLSFADEEYERLAEDGPDAEPALREAPEDAVLQFYTSGTTGRPKGVLMSQQALLTHGLNTLLSQGLSHDDVFLTCTPVTHSAGGTRIFTLGVEAIAHVILPRWSPEAFYAEVARRRVTTTVLVPSMLRDLVHDEGLAGADLASLRLIVYGAAPTPPDVQAAALARIPAGFLHSYGISEGCPALTALTPQEHAEALRNPDRREWLSSVGRPVPGVRFRIVDDTGAPVRARTPGEIQIRSAKAMIGYWHRPEDEKQVWRDGWMASGDIGYLDESGYLYIIGRKKEMIISGGLNVYPAEVERALLEHPDVGEVAVLGIPHPRWGETPVAFLVASGDVTDDELTAHLRARLARYKLPSLFRRVDALPRNETGKVLKTELALTISTTPAGGTARDDHRL